MHNGKAPTASTALTCLYDDTLASHILPVKLGPQKLVRIRNFHELEGEPTKITKSPSLEATSAVDNSPQVHPWPK